MLFANLELHKLLDAGRLVLRPEPQPRMADEHNDCPYGTHSVDLTLGAELSIPLPGPYIYDLTQPGRIADFISGNAVKRTIKDTRRIDMISS
jgi:hypothetical protein